VASGVLDTKGTGRVRTVACLLATAGMAGLASPALASTTATTHPSKAGTADVAYAGSLLTVNEKVVGPAFQASTGYGYTGRGAESLAVAQEIVAGTITPGVFESVGGTPIKVIEPKFTTWYAGFAASPIVIAYNPTSKYAARLKSIAAGKLPMSSLFALMATPGFQLGRTDPNTDPQGRAFVLMTHLAQKELGVAPSTVSTLLGGTGIGASSQIYSETSLLAHLEAGQLDATSAYRSQAIQQHLPYISLPDTVNFGNPAKASIYKSASLTLTSGQVVMGSPLVLTITTVDGPKGADQSAGEAFVRFVLSSEGRAIYQRNGYTLLPVTLTGSRSAVPSSIRSEISK
jgi:molybdate/tungstate transport system substrate-binding protein